MAGIPFEYNFAIENNCLNFIVQTSNLFFMATTKWILDPSHSELEFKVKHMMISNVSGKFTKFDASLETEGEDFMTAKITFTADIASINTGQDPRDEHLKSAEFFDA